MKHFLALILIIPVVVSAERLKGSKSTAEEKDLISQLKFGGVERLDYTVVGELPTDGYCWIHENGKLCFQGTNFQSVTKIHDELYIESFIDSIKYSYSIANVDKVKNDYLISAPASSASSSSGNRKLQHAISEFESIFDSYDGVKYDCKVEEAKNFAFDASDFEILAINADGSSLQKFHDMIIYVDSNMVPINIQTPNEDNTEFELLAAITEVEKIEEDFEGCDPDIDVEGALDESVENHGRSLRILEAHNPSVSEEDYFSTVGRERKLDFLTDFQAWASNTQWCGAGTNIYTTPCPNSGNGKDFWADIACRRHDHGDKVKKTWIGLPRMECFVDKQLVDLGGHNYAVSAAYGSFGAMGAIGCYNWESYKCWRNWSYRHCGYKWDVNYGPFRYNGAVKKAGYEPRPKTCPTDSWISW